VQGGSDEADLDHVELDERHYEPRKVSPRALASVRAMPGRMPEVSYLVSAHVVFYRLILDVLHDEERRLGLQLSTDLIAERCQVALAGTNAAEALPDIEAMLTQLHRWGNVDRFYSNHRKGTYQEYLRRDYVYQLTPIGTQIHDYISQIDTELGSAGALQSSLLPEILDALLELHSCLEPDPGQAGIRPQVDNRAVYRALQRVFGAFGPMSDNAKLFVQGLNRTLELDTAIRQDAFLQYKSVVVEYLQTYSVALMEFSESIVSAVVAVEQAGLLERFDSIARVEAAPQLGIDLDQIVRADSRLFLDQWQGLRQWFFTTDGLEAVAGTLQDRAVDAVNRIVSIVRRLNEQRFHKIDRKADLLTLARWFSAMPDGADRARLWQDAFGLYPSRHAGAPQDAKLGIDVRPKDSWWDTTPAPVDVRLRVQGPRATRGRPQSIGDPRAAKARLAAQQRAQDHAVESAYRLLADRGPVRLSELRELASAEFRFVLTCLHLALAGSGRAVRSSDGRLEVRLRPPTATAGAELPVTVLHTDSGRLALVDYELTVVDRHRERM
jgi:uncharacterized protein (TIGR02677 family)